MAIKPTRLRYILVGSLVLLAALSSYLTWAPRGTVMVPARALAQKLNITIPLPELSAEGEKLAKIATEDWQSEILEKYPELRVIETPVPDDENGFLQLSSLFDRVRPSEDLAAILRDLANVDPQVAKATLAENQEWITAVSEIASLPDQSNHDAFLNNFAIARPTKAAADTFLLLAIIAASEKDELLALENVRSVNSIFEHVYSIEAPNFLSETVAILISLSSNSIILEEILHRIGEEADLRAWREVINPYIPDASRLRNILRGEFHHSRNEWAYLVFEAHFQRDFVDPIDTLNSLASVTSELSQRLELDFDTTLKDFDLDKYTNGLSMNGKALVEIYHSPTGTWSDAAHSLQVGSGRFLAAIDLLIYEKSGSSVVEDSFPNISLDPSSEKPFIFDPSARTLRLQGADTDNPKASALQLPW